MRLMQKPIFLTRRLQTPKLWEFLDEKILRRIVWVLVVSPLTYLEYVQTKRPTNLHFVTNVLGMLYIFFLNALEIIRLKVLVKTSVVC